MKYTIIINNEVFMTNWYEYENNYVNGMIVINNMMQTYSINGVDFIDIEEDNL